MVSPLNTVMIKGPLKEEGWWGRRVGVGAVKRGHCGQEERSKGKSLCLYLPFPAPFLATLIICKSRQSHAATRDKTRVTKYQLPATKLKAVIRISGADGN